MNTPANERAREAAKQFLNAAESGIVIRREHPSFGYTKAGIRSLLDQAQGALVVDVMLYRDTLNAGGALLDDNDPLVMRLRSLRRQIKEAK